MNIRNEILRRLADIEQTFDVRILYACESGSRAWGFDSPDSDYDVRFIYVRPQVWYLSFDVEKRRDVIEKPIVDEIDCNGWDIRKALYLFARTNGALLEWLSSPITYCEHGETVEALRQLAPRAFNATALCYHYSHMARGNAREYLFGDLVRLKKYFYVLRPLLAIRFIQEFGAPPPVAFQSLVDAVAPQELHTSIAALLEKKRHCSELGMGEPVPEIDGFIRDELERHGQLFSGQGRPELEQHQYQDELNRIFRAAMTTAE